MIQHMNVHSTNRPKEKLCVICNQKFYRTADLNRHMKTHTQRGTHVSACGKVFSRADAIERHRRKTRCNICNVDAGQLASGGSGGGNSDDDAYGGRDSLGASADGLMGIQGHVVEAHAHVAAVLENGGVDVQGIVEQADLLE